MTLYTNLFWLLLPLVALAAFRWGGGPERIVAVLYLVAAAATLLARSADPTRYHGVEVRVLIVDFLLLAGLALVAVRADRWWPLWATAFQTISTLAHVGKALNPGLWRLGYAIMAEASSYPTLILLAIGVWYHARARTTAPMKRY